MTTDQNYVGKASYATTTSQTVKSDLNIGTPLPTHPHQRKRQEFSLRFRIRSTQENFTKQVNLQIRLTINGVTTSDYSSGIHVIPDKWEVKRQRVAGRSGAAAEINERLAEVELQHREILRELKRRHSRGECPLPTAALIKEEYQRPGSTELTLEQCYTRFLNFLDTQVGTEEGYSEKTFSRYYQARKYLRQYLTDTSEQTMLTAGVTTAWARRFHTWLQLDPTGEHRMKKDSANYYLACVRKALDFAVEEGYRRDNPIDKFRPKRGKGKPVYFLEPVHIGRVLGLDLSGSMSITLWWAKLMCLTGLDYCDAVRYARKRSNFEQYVLTEYEQISEAGASLTPIKKELSFKIVIERSKPPRNVCEIPLLPQVEALFVEYPTGPPAPVLADINRNLKVIQDAIGFDRVLTSKICRKTAGVLFLRIGFQLPTVSKILGHSSIRTTEQHYVRVVSSHVDHDIERVTQRGEVLTIQPEINHQPFFRIECPSVGMPNH